MIHVEREICEALRRHERDVPPLEPSDVPVIARRTRRRQAVNVLGVSLLAAILVGSTAAGVGAIMNRADRSMPATPEPTPTSPPTAGPTTEPTEPASKRTGLYLLDPATGAETLVFEREGWLEDPERSPGGGTIAFEGRNRGERRQIYVRGADGEERRLTDLPRGAFDPTWSPDGSQIAFVGFGDDADIFVMNADGSDPHRVGGTDAVDALSDWSPDGTSIVFTAGEERASTIWVVSVSDGSLVQLTHEGEGDGDAAATWSPDGTQIAFVRTEDAPGKYLEADDSDLWVMRPDGSSQHRLVTAEGPLDPSVGPHDAYSAATTSDGHYQSSLTWSPDGNQIAWSDVHRGVSVLDIPSQEIRTVISGFWSELRWTENGILAVPPDR